MLPASVDGAVGKVSCTTSRAQSKPVGFQLRLFCRGSRLQMAVSLLHLWGILGAIPLAAPLPTEEWSE